MTFFLALMVLAIKAVAVMLVAKGHGAIAVNNPKANAAKIGKSLLSAMV